MEQVQHRTRGMKVIEAEIGKPVDSALWDLYIRRGWTLPEIAAEWGCSVPTLSRWMRDLGIPVRVFGIRRRQRSA